MPSKSPEALERRNARRTIRQRERRAEAREKVQKVQKVRKPKPPPRRIAAPFAGVDGEGIGRADRHAYALFRIGARELFAGGRRLTTPELLQFITSASADPILVAFAFEYDASNILRDLPLERQRSVLRLDMAATAPQAPLNPYEGNHGWTWLNFEGFPTFGVSYVPRNYLRVCIGQTFVVKTPDGKRRSTTFSRKGSTRTIYDTFGFFQSSFLKALNDWGVGREHWEAIAAGKNARATFEEITPSIRRYCAIECDLLAELMEQFRSVCVAAGMIPKTWNGAGKLAATLLDQHGAMTREAIEAKLPKGLLDLAHAGYFGGRFEITRAGSIRQKVHERDINSAYPAAMGRLPCLYHGAWRKASAGDLMRAPRGSIYVCSAEFTHPKEQFLCGLPIRSKDGRLSWPRAGAGVYWSPEIESAETLGATVARKAGWLYQRRCDCKPFDWIEPLYEKRRALKKDTRGVPIKLGLNSLYGKQAQRIGRPRWANPVNAGLITAFTRALINEAIAALRNPRDCIMIATDAIYTIGKAPRIATGDRLGQWGAKEHSRLFLVRPGLYWPPKPRQKAWRIKSRGLSPKFFEPRVKAFERAWAAFSRRVATGRDPFEITLPVVNVETDTFVGLRLALHLGRPREACRWIKKTIACTFKWTDKRGRSRWSSDRAHVILDPLPQAPGGFHSVHYDAAGRIGSAGAWDEERMWLEAQPDPVDLSPPFTV